MEPEITIIGDISTKGLICYKVGDKYHRSDGPAVIVYKNNKVVGKAWFQHGRRHRDGKPSVTARGVDMLVVKAWYHNNCLHRTGGPARTIYKDGAIISQEWWQHNELCRSGLLTAHEYADIKLFDTHPPTYADFPNVNEFRTYVKGDAIGDALRPLPMPIRDAIIEEYCFQ